MTSCCPEEPNREPQSNCACKQDASVGLKPDFPLVNEESAPCCGGPVASPEGPDERPGYRLWDFVDDFMETAVGMIPRVRTKLNRQDRFGTICARLGIGRDSYRIAPGLYGVGSPDAASPVMVTANYKLSFDCLRSSLAGVDVWILVLDTRSINVWCAAGKGTFSTQEVAERVQKTALAKLVSHRRLILPQLAATGVSARQVKTQCGFEVVWGPVHARRIKTFMQDGMKATPAMRRVTFTIRERVELIPVELNHLGKLTCYLVPALFLLSGLGQGIFSFTSAISRGVPAVIAYLLAATAGTVLVPPLLPWLPGRAFAIKGAGLGVAAGALLSAAFADRLVWIEMLSLTLFVVVVSSYLAMNFTGCTPFTSPTGVEKEMRRAIPVQAAGVLVAVVLWVGIGFTRG